MAEPNQQTAPQNPGGTDGNPGGQPPVDNPAATPPQKGGGSATQDDDQVTLSKEDYNNLIGQRDRSNQTVDDQNNFIESIAQERGINQFLKDNAEKYPDLSYEDLKHVDDPSQLDTEAARLQSRLEAHAQAKLLEIENHKPPQETPEQRAQREAELAKNPSRDSHEKWLAGRLK